MKIYRDHMDVEGMQIPCSLIRSARRSLALEIKRTDTVPVVIIRAPQRMKLADIERFISAKEQWIITKYKSALVDKSMAGHAAIPDYMTDEWIRTEGVKRFQKKIEHWSAVMKISYGRVTIRDQKTRWGSCSSKGNLNFNWRLLMMPEEIMDYVVVHELAHRREMNHSNRFWQIVEDYIPDYEGRRRWLKENGGKYM